MTWLRAQVMNLLILAALGVFVVYSSTQQRGVVTALCAFKADIELRHANGTQYVADVKAGRRKIIEGLTIADVERSLSIQQSTLVALSSLDCS